MNCAGSSYRKKHKKYSSRPRPILAKALARFLLALQEIESMEKANPGLQIFFRGGPPGIYDLEPREALTA